MLFFHKVYILCSAFCNKLLDFLTIKYPSSSLYMIIFLWLEPWMDYAYSAEKRKNPFSMKYIEEFQFNWIPGKNDKIFWKERPITISWYCWQTKNHLYIAVKLPSKAIQVSKSMSHGSKWDRPNSIHCCYVSQIHTNTTYSGYIREGEIFSIIFWMFWSL